jgi:hypothetical protein
VQADARVSVDAWTLFAHRSHSLGCCSRRRATPVDPETWVHGPDPGPGTDQAGGPGPR